MLKIEIEEDPKNNIKSNFKVVMYGVLLTSTGINLGLQVAIFNNFFEPFITDIHNITDEDEQININGNFAFLFFIGGLLASLTSSIVYEKLGRFKGFILGSILQIIFHLCLLIKSIYVIYAMRLLIGYVTFYYTYIAPMMMKEILPPKIQKYVGNTYNISISVGIICAYAYATSSTVNIWRIIFLIPLFLEIPRLIIFIIFYRIESPQWIMKKFFNDQELKKKLTNNYEVFYDKETSLKISEKFIQEQIFLRKKTNNKKMTFKDLFSPHYRKQFLFGLFLNFMQQAAGTNVLVFFSTTIYKDHDVSNPELYTFLFGVVGLIASILMLLLAKQMNKRIPMIIGFLGMTIFNATFILGLHLENVLLIIASNYLYFFTYSMYFSLLFPYTAAFLPSISFSLVSVTKFIVAILITKFVLNIIEAIGIITVFIGFFSMAFIGTIVFIGYSVETENKTEIEIHEAFRKKKFMR